MAVAGANLQQSALWLQREIRVMVGRIPDQLATEQLESSNSHRQLVEFPVCVSLP
jgi:hypothetical protein